VKGGGGGGAGWLELAASGAATCEAQPRLDASIRDATQPRGPAISNAPHVSILTNANPGARKPGTVCGPKCSLDERYLVVERGPVHACAELSTVPDAASAFHVVGASMCESSRNGRPSPTTSPVTMTCSAMRDSRCFHLHWPSLVAMSGNAVGFPNTQGEHHRTLFGTRGASVGPKKTGVSHARAQACRLACPVLCSAKMRLPDNGWHLAALERWSDEQLANPNGP
jgi:hypothetical protein